MAKTPNRSSNSPSCVFSPKDITSPNKDSHGISKTVFTHVSNIHKLLYDWIKIRDNGAKICKTISALRLHEYNNDYYPQQLKPLTESLLEALDSLRNIVEGVDIIDKQLAALAKLQPDNEPIILTWATTRIAENVNNILNSLQEELKLKQIITENIAHCRDENLIEVYVSTWELEVYCHPKSYAYLFAEVGLPSIT